MTVEDVTIGLSSKIISIEFRFSSSKEALARFEPIDTESKEWQEILISIAKLLKLEVKEETEVE